MKLILTVLGVVLLVVAAVYFLLPADQLPGFFPGHEAGVTRMHYKHGVVAGVAGIVLLAAGAWMGRRGGADPPHHPGAIGRRDADVAPGDESGAFRHPECPPSWRPCRPDLGRPILELARDRRPRVAACGRIGRARRGP